MFLPRFCPLCGTAEGQTLLAPEAAEFCGTNWTYDPRWREILGLPDLATFPIRRCVACGFVYAALLPDDAFLELLYDRVIVKELCVDGSEHSAGYAVRLGSVADMLRLAAPGTGRALDYGSGAGVTLRILAACAVDAWGHDPSHVRARYSREAGSRVLTDRESLRAHAPFTLFVLDNVLEHVPEPVGTIRFLSEIAAERAVAFVSVPSFERRDLERETGNLASGHPLSMTVNPWEHLNYFSLASLDEVMRLGGFERVPAAELQRAPDIGLRAERSTAARLKNSVASALRLARWALTGIGVETTERRFYRRR